MYVYVYLPMQDFRVSWVKCVCEGVYMCRFGFGYAWLNAYKLVWMINIYILVYMYYHMQDFRIKWAKCACVCVCVCVSVYADNWKPWKVVKLEYKTYFSQHNNSMPAAT